MTWETFITSLSSPLFKKNNNIKYTFAGKAMEKLHNLIHYTNSASVCYDIALEIFEIALLKATASGHSCEDNCEGSAEKEDEAAVKRGVGGAEEAHDGDGNSVA